MIKKLLRAKEINIIVRNEVGALSRIMSFLVNHGINIETIAGYSNNTGNQGSLIFITDNNADAIGELIKNGYEDLTERDVIVVELENRPGALKNISELLALSEINIDYIYCTTCPGGCPAKVVLSTSNNDRAIKILSSR
ncbi:hypothetical protein KA005_52700 [bacterium]|nr:hypothetical protein [bacterium]